MLTSDLIFLFLALAPGLSGPAPLPANNGLDRTFSLIGGFKRDSLLGATLSKRVPEILNIIGHSHSGQITHDISHYFEVEESDVGSQQRFNNSKILKSSTLEQVMSSDHPPFKRDDGLRAAVTEAFPKLLEPVDDTQDSFVYFGHAILQTLGALYARSDRTKPEQQLDRVSRTKSPRFMKERASGISPPGT